MTQDATTSIGAEDTAFRLELTPAQLKITHTALRLMLDGYGREERVVHDVVKQVLAKFPDEASIRAIKI